MILRNMMMGGLSRQGGLLVDFPGAISAFSTRALITGGQPQPLLRVRRSSDDAELDIGYIANGDLDETTLLNFVGSNDGFVSIWYDQSGNNNHVTQATFTRQPLIVSNGNVINVNGKPSVAFTSGTAWMRNSNFSMNTNPHSIFSVIDAINLDTNFRRVFTLQRALHLQGSWIYGASTSAIGGGSRHPDNLLVTQSQEFGQIKLYYMTNSPNYQEMGIDRGAVSTVTSTVTHVDVQQLRIGQGDQDTGLELWQGRVQEFILYPFNQNSNRTAIEQDQRNYWGGA